MPSIIGICPMENYLMEVKFSNGNTVILNLANKLNTIRFRQLQDKKLFESATTDGNSIRWNELIEISTTEVFDIVQNDLMGL